MTAIGSYPTIINWVLSIDPLGPISGIRTNGNRADFGVLSSRIRHLRGFSCPNSAKYVAIPLPYPQLVLVAGDSCFPFGASDIPWQFKKMLVGDVDSGSLKDSRKVPSCYPYGQPVHGEGAFLL